MLDSSQRPRVLVSLFTLLIALAGANCSSDTRAILAPSDSQLTLTASGSLIANQAGHITVVAAKSERGALKDGTEIQLSGSAGEFEPSKVRVSDPGFRRPGRVRV